MKVLITAGGTVEKIDNVRSITNISTGRLGSAIASEFSRSAVIDEIFYLCSKSAILPQSEKTTIIYIDSVANLENTITEILSGVDIDIIVHSMAVSDYRVKTISSVSNIAKGVISKIRLLTTEPEFICALNEAAYEAAICDNGKINSSIDDMLLFMERTPKIISMFHKLTPRSVLVGFKLLDSVPLETLISAGVRVLEENKCSFVLANDLKDVNDNYHIGYLIDENRSFTKYEGRNEIAAAIVAYTIQKRRNGQ